MQTLKNSDKCPENNNNSLNESQPLACIPDFNPQQQEITLDQITFDSKFDSGNLAAVTRQSTNHVLYFFPRCHK